MQRTEPIQGDNFLDVLKNIEGMSSSRQRFIQEMPSQRRQAPALPKERILKKELRTRTFAHPGRSPRVLPPIFKTSFEAETSETDRRRAIADEESAPQFLGQTH